MSRLYRLVVAAAALVGSACSVAAEPPRVDPFLNAQQARSGACVDWRWIAVKARPGEPCPRIAGWNERELFATPYDQDQNEGYDEKDVDPGKQGALDAQAVPPGLRLLCLYEHPGEGNDDDLPSRVEARELARADRDCAGVATIADPLGDLLWPEYEKRFLAAAGRAPAAGSRGRGQGVRLAFVDTQPTGDGVPTAPGKSRHGYSLVHMANRLTSGTGVDPRFATRLALTGDDLKSLGAQAPPAGGHIGTLGELAEAIHAEVAYWRRHARAKKERHLVLNLSVGWNGRLLSGLDAEVEACHKVAGLRNAPLELSAAAVHCALQVASCRGALVFAAAGNRSGGPRNPGDPDLLHGPLLPAAWQAHPAPDAAACDALLGERDEEGPTRPRGKEPLLHAVAGVQGNGAPLPNARPRSEPRLVAYGDHAVVRDHGRRPTSVLTGSSVASAVASAAATAVWSRDPALSRREVVEQLYASAAPLGRAASFSTSSSPPEVRQVSICRALGKRCPTLPEPTFQVPPSAVEISAVPLTRIDSVGVCNARVRNQGGLPRDPCPFSQFYSVDVHPWATPQPQCTPCPNCGIFSNSPCQVVISIPSEFVDEWPGELLAVTLDVDGELFALQDLPPLERIRPGQVFVVRDIPDCYKTRWDDVRSVTLGFLLDDGAGELTSIESPVFLMREGGEKPRRGRAAE